MGVKLEWLQPHFSHLSNPTNLTKRRRKPQINPKQKPSSKYKLKKPNFSRVLNKNRAAREVKRQAPTKQNDMQNGGVGSSSVVGGRQRLSVVVADCVRRWFEDTLKEAKSGDVNMQVLVSQMYSSGYGVPPDPHKGKQWMTRASRTRSSVWRVNGKRPGYNASDSDSESDGLVGNAS